MYEFEQKKLYHYLGSDLFDSLKYHRAYIAGGTVTSLFSNRDINDIDIYFRDENSLVNFLYDIWDDRQFVLAHTKKATLLKYDDVEIQLVHFDYFADIDAIFDTFDFTVCMGAFDFADEQFHLHPDFLQHNSQRILKFNRHTAFPIVSLLRVQKYRDKGYKISKPEFIRIALACMNLDITSWDDLREQMGGMYGVNYDKLFTFDDDTPFDLPMIIDKLADLVLDDDYFNEPVSLPFNSVEDIIDNIVKGEIEFLEINDDKYRIRKGVLSKVDRHDGLPKQFKTIDASDYIMSHRFYKFVRKTDAGRYLSYYDDTFEYRIGETVEARVKESGMSYQRIGKWPLLYFNELSEIKHSSHGHYNDKVLIEVSIDPADFNKKSGSEVTATKCTVLREVPASEWEPYMNNGNRKDMVF